ncbi:MAG: alpha/beta hydrolase [Bacteroidia bacterium]|nr:alpha/beta hydrolase [Bacteroidia bacterium]
MGILFSQNINNADRYEKILEQFKCERNIVYKTVNGENLDMILFLPGEKKYEKAPVMIYTHGGGWGKGDKYSVLNQVFLGTLKTLTENGIACAAIEYRLTRPDTSTVFDCVVDCKDAARFLIKNAMKYGLDPSYMGVWGGSAGGHLSLMTALGHNEDFMGDPELKSFDPHFKCVASYFPLTSFMHSELLKGSNFENPQRLIPMFGGLFDEKKELARLVSPAEYLTKNSPPILLLHGDSDEVLPYSLSTYFISVAKQNGADAKLITVKGAGHSFKGENISPSMSEINLMSADFILSHLVH